MFITIICVFVQGDELKKSFTTSSTGFSFFSTALTVLGFILLAVYALALITKSLKWVTFSTLPFMLAIIAVAIFALTVSSKGGGVPISGRAYKEYNLTSYSKWMQNKVDDASKWQTYYKTYIASNNVCSDLTGVHHADTTDQFYLIKLSSLQSGCCKPLKTCDFKFVNPTNWTSPPEKGSNSTKDDCSKWSNDQSALCYNCDSCKAGFLQDVKQHWFKTAVILLVSATVEVVFYVTVTIICCSS